MNFKEYETEAMLSDKYPRVHREGLNRVPVYCAMALSGEAGEASEKVKKAWRDEHNLDHVEYAKELGDALWYITAAAKEIGLSLETVAQLNIDKLRDRRNRDVLGGSGDNR